MESRLWTRWTEQENDLLIEYVTNGRTYAWMSAKLGRSVPAVSGQLKKLRDGGVIPRKRFGKVGPRGVAERQVVPKAATMTVSSAYLRALELKVEKYDELTKELRVLAEQTHVYMNIVEQLAKDFPHVLDEVCE